MEPLLHPRRHPANRLTATAVMLAGLACLLAARPAAADTISTLAPFNNSNGANPRGGVTLDAAGNLYGTATFGGANNLGTVFEIAKGSNAITTLATFNYSNGANPYSGVTLDAAGNLYGTTAVGGASPNGSGSVFELAKGSNTITTVASFNGTNGASPIGGVTLDAAGNLYGTTSAGGTLRAGSVFEIAKGSNVVITLASFNVANGANPYSGVTLDAAGNLYGTTTSEGANSRGTVFEIVKGSNTITTLASFNGTNGQFPSAGVTLDAAGNLFGTTTSGGANNLGTVFEIAKGSNAITTLASFQGTDGETPFGGVTLDAAGNLFGTAFDGGPRHEGSVFEVLKGSNTISTLALFTGDNGMGPNAGVTLDAAGNLFGTTQNGGPYDSGGLGVGDGTVFELTTAAVPEPVSVLLLGIGVFALAGHAAWRRLAARTVADLFPVRFEDLTFKGKAAG